MDVKVTVRHGDLTAEERGHAEERARAATRVAHPLERAEIILDHEGNRNRWRAEMTTHGGRGMHASAHAEATSVHAVIDAVAAKLVRQLSKVKEKREDRKKHRTRTGIIAGPSEKAGTEEGLEPSVESTGA